MLNSFITFQSHNISAINLNFAFFQLLSILQPYKPRRFVYFFTLKIMNHLFELPEKICYVQCGICTTILLVSVPCSSLSMAVTVTCGHCSSLLSVNMMKATLVPLHFLSSLSRNVPKEACREMNSGKFFDSFKRSNLKFSEYEVEEGLIPVKPPFVNKPPEKRQRAPSAYNCFIKDEIRRLKAQNPEMTHKEAFRTAAKNWANFPPIQEKDDTEGCNQVEENGS